MNCASAHTKKGGHMVALGVRSTSDQSGHNNRDSLVSASLLSTETDALSIEINRGTGALVLPEDNGAARIV